MAATASAQELPVQFGVAAGALHYQGGRQEQALGAVLRWYMQPWLSLGTTPTMVRAQEPAISPATGTTSRSGLTDIPVEATLSHGFGGPLSVSLSGTFAVTLPVGDTAKGLGAGAMGSSVSAGLGFAPAEGVWVYAGAGRSLTRFAVQSAFSSGTGWGDVSAGYSLTDRVSVSAGYSTDLGAVDSTLGRSTSLDGGLSFGLGGKTTLNLTTSHRLSGSAPDWSLAIGIGTAFPYLTHLGPGGTGSLNETLQNTFGGGTHGITPPGNSGTAPGQVRKKGRSGG